MYSLVIKLLYLIFIIEVLIYCIKLEIHKFIRIRVPKIKSYLTEIVCSL